MDDGDGWSPLSGTQARFRVNQSSEPKERDGDGGAPRLKLNVPAGDHGEAGAAGKGRREEASCAAGSMSARAGWPDEGACSLGQSSLSSALRND